MAKHEPLFMMNGKYLYREQNLIIIQVPVFFVCKDDEGQRYLVLLSDFYEDTYVLCPVSNVDLYNMLSGNITMRKPFRNASIIYYVTAGTDLSDDVYKKVPYNYIENILPDDGAFFEVNEDDALKSYISSLCFEPVITIKRVKTLYCQYKTIQKHFNFCESDFAFLDEYRHKSNEIKFERSFFNEQSTVY